VDNHRTLFFVCRRGHSNNLRRARGRIMNTFELDFEGFVILNDLLCGRITRATAKRMYAALLYARGIS